MTWHSGRNDRPASHKDGTRPGKKTWDRAWSRRSEPGGMGDLETYAAAVGFLDLEGCVLEDWGGGTAYAKSFVQRADYRNVDGSPSSFVDEVAELEAYRSEADCILLRHVLEHNHNWPLVLANAAASFQRRLAIVLYTPLAGRTEDHGSPSLPVYSFAIADLMAVIRTVRPEAFVRSSWLGQETIVFAEAGS